MAAFAGVENQNGYGAIAQAAAPYQLASQDVMIEVVRELEKQQWMLRAQLGEHA